jgi:hypothetical protein
MRSPRCQPHESTRTNSLNCPQVAKDFFRFSYLELAFRPLLLFYKITSFSEDHRANWAQRNTQAIAGVAALAFAHKCAFGN